MPRQVVRVVTPGLNTDGDQLEKKTNNWLCALEISAASSIGVALLDLSTGELFAAQVRDLAAVLGELARAEPKEILLWR